ncbi:hypothetical protein VP01_153g2 [Puccinia sorghi]|uniref:Uncharacterized protein n=1 Tax=Puccinia sorghi TaxID=27349 RepID=A0A0L6VK84_9BASI|nr:hypothetical protein VP01_153g2 [Puccinia sorghi]
MFLSSFWRVRRPLTGVSDRKNEKPRDSCQIPSIEISLVESTILNIAFIKWLASIMWLKVYAVKSKHHRSRILDKYRCRKYQNKCLQRLIEVIRITQDKQGQSCNLESKLVPSSEKKFLGETCLLQEEKKISKFWVNTYKDKIKSCGQKRGNFDAILPTISTNIHLIPRKLLLLLQPCSKTTVPIILHRQTCGLIIFFFSVWNILVQSFFFLYSSNQCFCLLFVFGFQMEPCAKGNTQICQSLSGEPSQSSPNKENHSSQPTHSNNPRKRNYNSKKNAEEFQNLSEDWDEYNADKRKHPTNQDFLSSLQGEIKLMVVNKFFELIESQWFGYAGHFFKYNPEWQIGHPIFQRSFFKRVLEFKFFKISVTPFPPLSHFTQSSYSKFILSVVSTFQTQNLGGNVCRLPCCNHPMTKALAYSFVDCLRELLVLSRHILFFTSLFLYFLPHSALVFWSGVFACAELFENIKFFFFFIFITIHLPIIKLILAVESTAIDVFGHSLRSGKANLIVSHLAPHGFSNINMDSLSYCIYVEAQNLIKISSDIFRSEYFVGVHLIGNQDFNDDLLVPEAYRIICYLIHLFSSKGYSTNRNSCMHQINDPTPFSSFEENDKGSVCITLGGIKYDKIHLQNPLIRNHQIHNF